MDQELETFKKIPFQDIAEKLGYWLDPKESSINSRILRGPHDDKISVRQDNDEHWTYFSIRDDEDNGSVIDFIQRRKNLNLGQARKFIREIVKGFKSHNSFSSRPVDVQKKANGKQKDPGPDPKTLQTLLSGVDHPYLLHERQIPRWIFRDPRFEGIIFKDPSRGNVMFPHRTKEGICGYEVRNRKFAGFLGRREGFWITNKYEEARSILICESAIDCLSHASLFPPEKYAYISLAGSPSGSQKALLQRVLRWASRTGKTVISGVDQDKQGDIYTKTFESLTQPGMLIRKEYPPEAKDWNDVLKGKIDGVKYF